MAAVKASAVGAHFNVFEHFTSVVELGKGFSQLKQLAELKIDLSGCTAFASVDKLGRGISQLQQCTELEIDLNPCSGLTLVDELGKRECPAQLKELKICFSECSGSTSDDGLGKALPSCGSSRSWKSSSVSALPSRRLTNSGKAFPS